MQYRTRTTFPINGKTALIGISDLFFCKSDLLHIGWYTSNKKIFYPLEWFMLTVLGYFVLGFGGTTFDFACNRFRNSGNVQFVKWEFAALIGGFIELFFIIALKDTMGFFDLLSSFIAWVICIGLTVLLGLNTRASTRWI